MLIGQVASRIHYRFQHRFTCHANGDLFRPITMVRHTIVSRVLRTISTPPGTLLWTSKRIAPNVIPGIDEPGVVAWPQVNRRISII